MKRLLIFMVLGVLSILAISPALAVENGVDETGSSFVVPILVEQGTNQWGGCSGALIAASIVVTAAHCAVDANGLQTNNIYVGDAGSSLASVTTADIVASVTLSSSYQLNSNGNVANDDLAFLILTKPQIVQVPLTLASESDINSLKNSNGQLKLIGYGAYGDTSTTQTTFPKSYEGFFSSIQSPLPNSAYLASTSGDSCEGDSGAPILSISATHVILIGINNGSVRSHFCTARNSNGQFLSDFVLVGRYANLAFAAANTEMNFLQNEVDSSLQTMNSQSTQIQSLTSQLAQSRSDLSDANSALQVETGSLSEANQEIERLKAQIPVTLTCAKGKLIKKITGISAKCPSGFRA